MKKRICMILTAALLFACLPAAAAGQHPAGNTIYNGMLPYSSRDVIRETMAAKRNAVAEAAAMSAADYADRVRAALPNDVLTRPAYEKETVRLAQIYAADGGTETADKVVHALVLTAQHYDMVSATVSKGQFSGMSNLIPVYLVIAYDLVYDSGAFARLDGTYAADTRALVEAYFTTLARRMYEENKETYINNMGGFAIKNLVGTAWILNDPTMMRWAVALMDDAFAPSQWYADGMWSEGTTSYGQQLMGNCVEALNILKLWDDPAGYQDELLGLELQHTDLTSRWPIIAKARQAINMTKYPNGSVMAVHDTHPTAQSAMDLADPSLPIQTQYLDNLELNHFGLYAMRHGTTAGAQQVELLFPPTAAGIPYGGGHGHGNYLAMTYWAGGVELLPDGGYPVAGNEQNRFFHMSAVTHNDAWITPEGVSYNSLYGQYTRPALLGYDDGTASGGAVQFIEASQPMPPAQQNEVKRRALVTVAVDDTHSYTLDVQRLRGGVVHENFLRGSEDETMDVTLDAPVSSNAANLGKELQAEGKRGLMAGQSLFTMARRGSAASDMKAVWTGQESGSSLHLFLKGVQGGEYALSSMPGMRRGGVNPPHLYQRREVSPQDTTVFGMVYEGTYAQETAKVQNVRWVEFEDSPMAVLVVVELADREDWIYLSDDLTPRDYEGVRFCGKMALVRRSKPSGQTGMGYIYGEGSICAEGKGLYSQPDFTSRVTDAQGDTLTLETALPAELEGLWGLETFADGSGTGHALTAAEGTQVRLQNDAGYEISQAGTRRTYHPAKIAADGSLDVGGRDPSLSDWVMDGGVMLRVPKPVFGALQTFGLQRSTGEIGPEGTTFQVSAAAQAAPGLQIYAVVQRETYADDSAHTLVGQEILSVTTAPAVAAGGEIVTAGAQAVVPREPETYYDSGNIATRVRLKSYLWDENLSPVLPAAAWNVSPSGNA